MHIHLSSCYDFSPKEVIEKYAELGYNSIAVTNHYTFDCVGNKSKAKEVVRWFIKDYNQAKKIGEKYGINVILGAEIRFSENRNDYLMYGINEDILEKFYYVLDCGLEEFKNNDEFKDVLIVQAHPQRNSCEEINPSFIDGMETFNLHTGHHSKIVKAVRDAKEKGIKIVTIGSDYHHEGGAGLGAIRTKEIIKDTFQLAEVLRSGDYIFDICEDTLILP